MKLISSLVLSGVVVILATSPQPTSEAAEPTKRRQISNQDSIKILEHKFRACQARDRYANYVLYGLTSKLDSLNIELITLRK